MPMNPLVLDNSRQEQLIPEGCYISEWSNSEYDEDCSIAHARVEPGVTTQWHRLGNTIERYVIVQGEGRVEVEGMKPKMVTEGNVVLIPANHRQRIQNIGDDDLIFLAICTPRFKPENYIPAE